MLKKLLLVAVLVVIFFCGFYSGRLKPTSVYAQAPASTGYTRTIPKTWGTFKGGALGGLVFEDSNGTLRLVILENLGSGGTPKVLETLTRQ